jgi:hypothetical protein
MEPNQNRFYGIRIFDDLDRYLPALLYDNEQFQTVSDVLSYVRNQAAQHLNHYDRGRADYMRYIGREDTQGTAVRSWNEPRRPRRRRQQRQEQRPQRQRRSLNELIQESMEEAAADPLTTEDLTLLSTFASLIAPRNVQLNMADLFDLAPVPVRPSRQQLEQNTELEHQGEPFAVAEGEACTICQDGLRNGNTQLRRIRHCGHVFHRVCIDTWLSSNVRCPICRHDVRETVARSTLNH